MQRRETPLTAPDFKGGVISAMALILCIGMANKAVCAGLEQYSLQTPCLETLEIIVTAYVDGDLSLHILHNSI
jgi:hypothetical protein